MKAYGSSTRQLFGRRSRLATALFFSGNASVQFNATLRDQATLRSLDLVDAARMFAAVDVATADADITVWHAKYIYGFWRPITAIQLADTDGNPATSPDPNWVPLIPTGTPPVPGVRPAGTTRSPRPGAALLRMCSHTQHLDLTLTSTAVPDVRHYDSGPGTAPGRL